MFKKLKVKIFKKNYDDFFYEQTLNVAYTWNVTLYRAIGNPIATLVNVFNFSDMRTFEMQCTNKNPADIFTNSRMIFLFYRPQEQYHRIGIKSIDPICRHNGLRITLEH